jgi:hypothetical protein
MRRRTLAFIVTAALVLASTATASAQAIAEDSKGTSIVLLDSTSAGINAGDSSIQLTLGRFVSDHPLAMGLLVKGKAANGAADLIKSGELQPGLEVGGTLAWKSSSTSVGIKATAQVARLTLFDAAAAAEDAITKPNKKTGSVGLLYNQVIANADGPFAFAMLGLSARHVNNWDDLKKTTVVQRSPVASPEGAGSRETVTETEARTGSFEEGWVGSLDGDAIFQLGDYPLSARGYVRAALGGTDSLRAHRFGIDAAVFKKGGDLLLDRLLSVYFEVNDPADDDKEQSWTLGLAVNVRFNLIQ